MIFNALLRTRSIHKVRLLILRNAIEGEFNLCVRRYAVAMWMALTVAAPIFLTADYWLYFQLTPAANILSLKPSGNHGWLDTHKNFSDKKKWEQHTRPQTCCRFKDASNSNANSWLNMLHEIRCTSTMNNVPCLNLTLWRTQWISQHRRYQHRFRRDSTENLRLLHSAMFTHSTTCWPNVDARQTVYLSTSKFFLRQ